MAQWSAWKGPFVRRAWAWSLALLLCCAPLAVAQAAENDGLLSRLKVAYLYNFTRFVTWPPLPQGQPFIIGVIGDPEMAERLRTLEDRQAEGRPIEIRSYASVEDITPSQVLFVGRAVERELETIVRRAAGEPTLLVGDTAGFAGRGAAIEFFLKPDVFRERRRLRFRVAPKALQNRGLTVSAQLMDVAEVIR